MYIIITNKMLNGLAGGYPREPVPLFGVATDLLSPNQRRVR